MLKSLKKFKWVLFENRSFEPKWKVPGKPLSGIGCLSSRENAGQVTLFMFYQMKIDQSSAFQP